jgi:hypothetical protein
MDLPLARLQNHQKEIKRKIEDDSSCIELPRDIWCYSLGPVCTPRVKNILRVSNTFFSKLFSWETVSSFMLHKELVAHPHDIQSLIIRCMHKQNKSRSEEQFIETHQKSFFSYQILGEPLFFVLEYDNEKKTDLYLFNHASREKNVIHPLLETCLVRNTAMVKDYLNSIDYKMFNLKKGLSFNIFRDAIQILIQNNDEASLALLLNSHKIGKKYIESAIIPSCSKFIQAALVVCVKPEIMQHMIRFYKIKNVSAMSTPTAHKEEDWIAKMLEKNPTFMDQNTEKRYLYDIIKFYHPKFKIMHHDKKTNYHANLCLLFDKATLKKLGITKNEEQELLAESDMPNTESNHENKKDDKDEHKNKSHNKCLIM